MDLAREQIFGSLDRQKEIQAQFDVLKGELLTSISNLQCLNLADVHRIVVAFYDEALEKHIAVVKAQEKASYSFFVSARLLTVVSGMRRQKETRPRATRK
jgi:hypothetical protein